MTKRLRAYKDAMRGAHLGLAPDTDPPSPPPVPGEAKLDEMIGYHPDVAMLVHAFRWSREMMAEVGAELLAAGDRSSPHAHIQVRSIAAARDSLREMVRERDRVMLEVANALTLHLNDLSVIAGRESQRLRPLVEKLHRARAGK